MRDELAFVGDVHGDVKALECMWARLQRLNLREIIFLGDYINKGHESALTLARLLSYSACNAKLLLGNHERALLEAITSQDLQIFLKLGGAATIRSYVRKRVGPDVLGEFLSHIPSSHLDGLRRMAEKYETPDLLATHARPSSATGKYEIYAHAVSGSLPVIRHDHASVDTGCGTGGRLTALLWPSLAYVQVDSTTV